MPLPHLLPPTGTNPQTGPFSTGYLRLQPEKLTILLAFPGYIKVERHFFP
jgi:hypothetical protein